MRVLNMLLGKVGAHLRWDEMGRDGMGWDETRWDEMRRDGMGRDEMG
jgi:hypothetical protein